MNTQELAELIEKLYIDFQEEHSKSSKSAHGRARKILGEMLKVIPKYRKASVAEDKARTKKN